VETVDVTSVGGVQKVTTRQQVDEGRAWHSAFFEMLGEQGYPGLLLFLLIHGTGLVRMEIIRRRYRGAEGDKAWIAPLATALQHFQIVYLVGAMFVAIAFTPFIFLMIAAQIGFDVLVRRREQAERPQRGWGAGLPAAPEPARA
jgi:O-antigen ligase